MWPSPSFAWWRRVARLLRTPLLLFLLLFAWLQLLTPGGSHSGGGGGGAAETADSSAAQPRNQDHSEKSYEEFLSRAAADDFRTPNGTNATHAAADVRWQVRRTNAEQKVWNEERLGPVAIDAVVFVVQVHTRLHYLRHLIESFRAVRGIEGALLVFSHDHFDADMNALVRSIDFARVLQIFYPYSTQLYVDVFPGQDPNDCPWDIKKETALQARCNNAGHPDLYGHYREAKYTQIKHHWWWKIHRVFDGLYVTRNNTGLVVFLEEDHYVVPDVLHILGILDMARRQRCAHCNVISLGTYVKTVNFASDSGRVEVCPWIASKHNMGMVLTRDNWEAIKACSNEFCNFDDYNWDWSLQHISATCLKNKLVTLMPRAPRIFHIGECGVHHKEKNCSSDKVLSKVQNLVSSVKESLFPSKLTLVRTSKRVMKTPKGNGGWGDLRDRLLCLHLLNATVL